MFGLLLGGLLGGGMRAAAARPLARPSPLGGLLRRPGGAAPRSDIGGGGKSTASGGGQDPVTLRQENAQQPPKPEQPQQEATPAAPEPIVSEMADTFKQQDKAQQVAQQQAQTVPQTQPVNPLEGLIDDQPQAAAPRQAPGTSIPEPPVAINPGSGIQTAATQEGQQFPSSPSIEQPFMADRIGQLPPRTIFEAPEANPSRPISTETKVSNSSPGYSTTGMTMPQYSFSYLRR